MMGIKDSKLILLNVCIFRREKFTLTSYGPPKNVLGFGFIIISNLILVFFS